MEAQTILTVLKHNYDKNIQAVELFRDGGNCSYTAYRANTFMHVFK